MLYIYMIYIIPFFRAPVFRTVTSWEALRLGFHGCHVVVVHGTHLHGAAKRTLIYNCLVVSSG